MSKAAASGLGRSAPDNVRFISSTRACSHRRRLVEARRQKLEICRTPPKRHRARKHHVGVALKVLACTISSPPTRLSTPVTGYEMVGSPAGSCANMTGAQCMGRRPAPGKSTGLPLRMPSPGSKEGHGCDEQARVLARTLPAERGHVKNVDACNERRSGADKACAKAGVGQFSNLPHPPGRDIRPRSPLRKGKNSPVHAAYGLRARFPVLKKPVGVAVAPWHWKSKPSTASISSATHALHGM